MSEENNVESLLEKILIDNFMYCSKFTSIERLNGNDRTIEMPYLTGYSFDEMQELVSNVQKLAKEGIKLIDDEKYVSFYNLLNRILIKSKLVSVYKRKHEEAKIKFEDAAPKENEAKIKNLKLENEKNYFLKKLYNCFKNKKKEKTNFETLKELLADTIQYHDFFMKNCFHVFKTVEHLEEAYNDFLARKTDRLPKYNPKNIE